ncbi:unnamed protein product [Spirodela intermedia]|uniref:Uncharacterized protein n=1 Tax=Spirodela intermedia TaxID=51605 RepID=A0ABN7E940_SPIIN|nr:unnamed protein product [Spirodela intermedia]
MELRKLKFTNLKHHISIQKEKNTIRNDAPLDTLDSYINFLLVIISDFFLYIFSISKNGFLDWRIAYGELFNDDVNNVPDVVRFLTVMSIYNNFLPTKSPSGEISYIAQSKDKDAPVNAAAQLHMVLVNRNENVLINFNASAVRYELLDTLEFTSDRKRI